MEPLIYRLDDPKPAGTPPVLQEELFDSGPNDVNLVRVDPGTFTPPHAYTAGDAFMLVLSGELCLHVDGHIYCLTGSHIAFIPRGARRGFTAGPEGCTFVAAHLSGV